MEPTPSEVQKVSDLLEDICDKLRLFVAEVSHQQERDAFVLELGSEKEAKRLHAAVMLDPAIPKGTAFYDARQPESLTIRHGKDGLEPLHEALLDLRDGITSFAPQKTFTHPLQKAQTENAAKVMLEEVARHFAIPTTSPSGKYYGNPDFTRLKDPQHSRPPERIGLFLQGPEKNIEAMAKYLEHHGLKVGVADDPEKGNRVLLGISFRDQDARTTLDRLADTLESLNHHRKHPVDPHAATIMGFPASQDKHKPPGK